MLKILPDAKLKIPSASEGKLCQISNKNTVLATPVCMRIFWT